MLASSHRWRRQSRHLTGRRTAARSGSACLASTCGGILAKLRRRAATAWARTRGRLIVVAGGGFRQLRLRRGSGRRVAEVDRVVEFRLRTPAASFIRPPHSALLGVLANMATGGASLATRAGAVALSQTRLARRFMVLDGDYLPWPCAPCTCHTPDSCAVSWWA